MRMEIKSKRRKKRQMKRKQRIRMSIRRKKSTIQTKHNKDDVIGRQRQGYI